LVTIYKQVRDFQPRVVAIDPVTNFLSAGNEAEVKSMLLRLVDFLKARQITALFTSLTHGSDLEATSVAVSSLMDTWLLLREVELEGARNRLLHVIKSRGMAHSHQVRELLLTSRGAELVDVCSGGCREGRTEERR
jgi:circadian clock protein KaiC